MAENYFESALNSLKKAPDTDRLQKILLIIRKDVEWPNKKVNIYKLQERGGLKYIVGCLLKNHPPILNTALSILGNCCMVRDVVQELVIQHSLLTQVSQILKRYSQDNIRGRAFRILGNICQHHDYQGNALLNNNSQLHIITNLISFLKSVGSSDEHAHSSLTDKTDRNNSKWSNATVCMAIRTFRELANAHTMGSLIQDFQVIKVIGVIALKFTPIWLNTGQHDDILEGVIKFLYVYSKHKNIDLIHQLQNCENGNAIDCLGKLLSLSPYTVVKIVMRLLKISNLRSDLPTIDISERLINKLKNPANFTDDFLHGEYLKCLCFLMHHPANKEDLRNSGIISVLVSILKDFVEETEVSLKSTTLIISNLRICMYDDISLLDMLKHDIINVLITKLTWAVGAEDDFDLSHVYRFETSSKKRRKIATNKCFIHKYNFDGLGFPCCYMNSDILCNYISYFKERSLSPSSDTSFSSGPSSPSNPGLSNNEDSDDYSPVCSDSEEKTLVQNTPIVNEEDVTYKPSPHYDEIDLKSCESKCEDESMRTSKKRLYTMSVEIVKLIKLFTKLRPVVMELVTTELLIKMLNFLFPKNAHICPPDILAVILSIVETPEYLLRLMQTDFVSAAYKLSVMSHGSDCITCSNLCYISRVILFKFTVIVETQSGKGDIEHQLHRASLQIKERLASAIPFVTGNRYIFSKLMIDCGGLNILIQSLQEHSCMWLRCLCSLSVLANKLEIKNPALKSQEVAVFLPIDINKYRVSDNCSAIVSFKTDDGSCIQADRDFLCQKSEYFKCLLSGEFKESCENEIVLHNIPIRALKLLFLLLQFDVNSSEIYKVDADLDLILDVIALCESYLLSDLCNCLTLSVQYFKLLPSTISTIYKWSLESGTDILRIECIAYALVATMDHLERNEMFQNLLDLGCTDKISNDIKNLLTRFLGVAKQ